jgi:hypothetical protein
MAAPFTIGLPSITVGGYRKQRTLSSVRRILRPRSTLAPVATHRIDYVGMVRWTSNSVLLIALEQAAAPLDVTSLRRWAHPLTGWPYTSISTLR